MATCYHTAASGIFSLHGEITPATLSAAARQPAATLAKKISGKPAR